MRWTYEVQVHASFLHQSKSTTLSVRLLFGLPLLFFPSVLPKRTWFS